MKYPMTRHWPVYFINCQGGVVDIVSWIKYIATLSAAFSFGSQLPRCSNPALSTSWCLTPECLSQFRLESHHRYLLLLRLLWIQMTLLVAQRGCPAVFDVDIPLCSMLFCIPSQVYMVRGPLHSAAAGCSEPTIRRLQWTLHSHKLLFQHEVTMALQMHPVLLE